MASPPYKEGGDGLLNYLRKTYPTFSEAINLNMKSDGAPTGNSSISTSAWSGIDNSPNSSIAIINNTTAGAGLAPIPIALEKSCGAGYWGHRNVSTTLAATLPTTKFPVGSADPSWIGIFNITNLNPHLLNQPVIQLSSVNNLVISVSTASNNIVDINGVSVGTPIPIQDVTQIALFTLAGGGGLTTIHMAINGVFIFGQLTNAFDVDGYKDNISLRYIGNSKVVCQVVGSIMSTDAISDIDNIYNHSDFVTVANEYYPTKIAEYVNDGYTDVMHQQGGAITNINGVIDMESVNTIGYVNGDNMLLGSTGSYGLSSGTTINRVIYYAPGGRTDIDEISFFARYLRNYTTSSARGLGTVGAGFGSGIIQVYNSGNATLVAQVEDTDGNTIVASASTNSGNNDRGKTLMIGMTFNKDGYLRVYWNGIKVAETAAMGFPAKLQNLGLTIGYGLTGTHSGQTLSINPDHIYQLYSRKEMTPEKIWNIWNHYFIPREPISEDGNLQ